MTITLNDAPIVLYKRTNTGATQQWSKEVDGARYRTCSGQYPNGVITCTEWTIATGKNIGKRNETTPEQQARIEVEADYTDKLSKGYTFNPETVDAAKAHRIEPMLAKTFDAAKVKFPVMVQPKLDGIRCIATKDGLFSRTGKPLTSTPHISDALAPIFAAMPTLILDGELYADKLAEDFGRIVSLVRKQDPDAAELAESAATIQYHIYDCPSVADRPFLERNLTIQHLFIDHDLNDYPCLVRVKTLAATSQAMIDGIHGTFLEQGYEGTIVRIPESKYEFKRSKGLLKYKDFLDGEFEIVRIEEGLGSKSGMAGSVVCRTPEGALFGSGVKGSHDHSRQILSDADIYVGGTATIRYFTLTPDLIPRFPVCVALYPGERDV